MALLNIVALVLSVIAVIFTFRQTLYLRQANHLPLFLDILREFRSADFQRDYEIVLNLSKPTGAPLALSGMPDPEKSAAMNVAYFSQSIAYLEVYGIMDEEFIIAALQTPIRRSWAALEPYIRSERINANGLQFRYYEHLAKRADTISLAKVRTRRKLARLDEVSSAPVMPTDPSSTLGSESESGA